MLIFGTRKKARNDEVTADISKRTANEERKRVQGAHRNFPTPSFSLAFDFELSFALSPSFSTEREIKNNNRIYASNECAHARVAVSFYCRNKKTKTNVE